MSYIFLGCVNIFTGERRICCSSTRHDDPMLGKVYCYISRHDGHCFSNGPRLGKVEFVATNLKNWNEFAAAHQDVMITA
uniref:Uncharacterized protein n=1 Tax=Arion vulgaris TaxID=1028688 RepID=A0A0B6ZVJ0_9EUPU